MPLLHNIRPEVDVLSHIIVSLPHSAMLPL